ncbi:MAG: 1-acyl-sn-glycerol-3-phosphate acyltransferase [Gammaproteobacteria bacterium]|nr:1-acyl-sn-glycerol-3-phosphate acyltransferase [Gammaproteobacteria bacterium]
MQYLRSIIFNCLIFLTMLPCAVFVLLARPFGRSASYRGAMAWVDSSLWLARVICNLDYTISGQENIPEENCIVYLKHSSVWETLAELKVFPEQTWVLKRELYWIPLFGWAVAALRPIAINRSAHQTAVRQVVRRGAELVSMGYWVMIFPEGTRMPPGTTRRYGMSGALLAQKTGRRIVPVAHNAEDFWPRRAVLKRPGTIQLIVGPPIETAGREPGEVNREAQAWIEGTMQKIGAAYRAPRI